MFVVSIAMVIVGFTLLYYAVGLWAVYRLNDNVAGALSLSYLFGFPGGGQAAPKLPFDESTSGTTSGSNTVSPSTGTSSGSGVQSV